MLLISGGFVVLFLGRVDAVQIVRHLRWLELYLPVPVLAAALVGLAILVIFLIRDPARYRLPALLLPFLAVPLVALLIDPMVTATQPWAIRRCADGVAAARSFVAAGLVPGAKSATVHGPDGGHCLRRYRSPRDGHAARHIVLPSFATAVRPS